MAGDVIGADAENLCPKLLQLRRAVAEGTRLARAAGRIVGRIKVQHAGNALEIGELDLGTVVGGERNLRGLVAFLKPIRHGYFSMEKRCSVVVRYNWPGRSTVLGSSGLFGESG